MHFTCRRHSRKMPESVPVVHGSYLTLSDEHIEVVAEPSSRCTRQLPELPGITQSEIADDTRISRSAAAWHLQRLDADGLVESDRDGRGRAVRYALTDDALEVLVDPGAGRSRAGRG